MEPNWNDMRQRLSKLTVKSLRTIGRTWFNGSLGGASSKFELVYTMVSQAQHWWNLPDEHGRQRVRNVLAMIEEMEG